MHEKAFKNLKIALCSETCIEHFDNRKEAISFTCADLAVVSAILIEKTPGKNDDKIAYSSRALKETETCYS